MDKADPNREISIDELDSAYLKHVGSVLEYILGCLTSGYQQLAVVKIQGLVDTKDEIDRLRKKALDGKLLLGEVLQHFRTEKKKRKPRRRKVLTRYQRVIKNFL